MQVHVQLPNASKICRKIGIDFAPALTGFEIRAGRSVPVLDGVVICEEFEETLRDAHYEDTRHRAEEARKKRLAEGESAWRHLLTALVTRLRVQRSYAEETGKVEITGTPHIPGSNVHPSSGRISTKTRGHQAVPQQGQRHNDNVSSEEPEVSKHNQMQVDIEEI